MLPVLNRPLADYVVDDCIAAGIEEIIFVVSEHNKQLLHYYRENKRLEEYLISRGQSELYEQISHLHTKAKFTFVNQPDTGEYGTAVPVKLAQEHLQDEEAFLVFMGDDFIYNGAGVSQAASMIELFNQSGAQALATCLHKPDDMLSKYGIATTEERGSHTFLKNIVEKPAPGTAPSNLANISKYIFTPAVFEVIENQAANEQSGELYITDTITELAQRGDVVIYTPNGEYLDGGNLLGWLKANLNVAKNDPELREGLEQFFRSEW